MKVNIITIHAMHNPGSVLQAFALQEYLSREHDARIIDYRPAYFYNEGSRMKLLAKKLLYGKAYRSRNRKFLGFVRQNMRLTQTFKTYEALKKAGLTSDVWIAGSDQLWNTDFPCGNDPAFYLKFAETGKKISYATSVGKKTPDEKNLQVLRENLGDFAELSVREHSTAETMSQLLNRPVAWCCDPVFLLPRSRYEAFLHDVPSEPYVMVYLAHQCEALDRLVAYYKAQGYRIILAGGVTRRCECDEHIMDVGPEDFLSLICNAAVVINSSFHATAFSHIFHRDFVTILPQKNGERIVSLLELTGLQNRSVTGMPDFSAIEQPIAWDRVDETLSRYVADSMDYLKRSI